MDAAPAGSPVPPLPTDIAFRRPRPEDEEPLTASGLADLLADLSESDPYFHRRNNHDRMQRLARRASHRLGRAFEAEWGLAHETIADALYFPVWTQLCAIVPLRRLARRFAGGDVVLIAAPSGDVALFDYWRENQALPLVFAQELRRRGVSVILIGDTARALRLTCAPPALWALDGPGPSDAVLGPETVRQIPDDLRNRAGLLLYDPRFWPADSGRAEIEAEPCSINIAQVEGVDGARTVDLGRDLSRRCLDEMLGVSLRAIAARIREIFAARDVRELHVSDVLTPVSCLLAAEARARGGVIHLWPHSANPVGVKARNPEGVRAISTVLRAGGEQWRTRFPEAAIHVRSDVMLPPGPGGPPAPAPDRLTIVLFGGARFHVAYPVFRIRRHEETLRTLVQGLLAIEPPPRVIFKPKGFWCSAEWFRGVAGDGAEILDLNAMALAAPNTLFVSVDHGSSALIEGIRLGVPGLIVRGQDVEDYTLLGGSPAPHLDVAAACALVAMLGDAAVVAGLVGPQVAWLDEETRDWPD
ncbi:hypothetical protein [Caulobacter hibisci]|uniref:Uncharacterized protein n=1 Tax=Caulobacter hibisci TaxID=2035993 RepID=A0ABS0SUH3_9CAUL|nr:hypothetical protein [Caulobacter hibisci]MBI1683297.1 hypothetical protein [Caulobacter hibisci]